jgi:hypothetical protein
LDEQGHNPPREATEEQIEGDQRLRRSSEPAEGGYGAEQEEASASDSSQPENEGPRD